MGTSASKIQFDSRKPNEKILHNQWITPKDVTELSPQFTCISLHNYVFRRLPKKISEISISSCRLEEFYEDLLNVLTQLDQLTSLKLYGSRLSKEIVKKISDLKNLTYLDFSASFTIEILKELCTKLRKLQTLKVSMSAIDDIGGGIISNNLLNLKCLDLYGNMVTDRGAKIISKFLKQLEWLGLGLNRITDEGIASVCQACHKLKAIQLINNKISNEGAFSIANNLPKMQQLNLSTNMIGYHGAYYLKRKLSKCQLILANNQLPFNFLSLLTDSFKFD